MQCSLRLYEVFLVWLSQVRTTDLQNVNGLISSEDCFGLIFPHNESKIPSTLDLIPLLWLQFPLALLCTRGRGIILAFLKSRNIGQSVFCMRYLRDLSLQLQNYCMRKIQSYYIMQHHADLNAVFTCRLFFFYTFIYWSSTVTPIPKPCATKESWQCLVLIGTWGQL